MNCCHVCIFQLDTQLWKAIIPKTKSPKISEFSLISLVGMSVLRLALFVLRLVIFFMISSRSTGKKLKDKPELQLFFIATMLGWNLYFMIAFISGSPILWLTGSVSLYWEITRVVVILEKNSFKIDAVFYKRFL